MSRRSRKASPSFKRETEELARRILPAWTATFANAVITATCTDDLLTFSTDASGNILANGSFISGNPTVGNTTRIDGTCGGGNLNSVDGIDCSPISGWSGTCSLIGSAGKDSLVGNAGSDTLIGGDYGDSLVGMGGADTVLGGEGADWLAGGSGSDTMTGDAGNDTM